MTFLTLMGALLIFGLLWLFLPRATTAVLLGVVSAKAFGIHLFASTANPWEAIGGALIVIATIVGVIFDCIAARSFLDDL